LLVGRGGAPASSPVIDGPGRSRRELPGVAAAAAAAAVLPWKMGRAGHGEAVWATQDVLRELPFPRTWPTTCG
jgi:hypothetical protein